MPHSRLQDELHQSVPFATPTTEAYLNLVRTHDRLSGEVTLFLKGRGISAPQYNALRILRGAGPDGLPSLAVAQRMVARVPDITRLLDRLAAKGWLRRTRSTEDRRVVMARITPKGRRIVDALDDPIVAFQQALLDHMTEEELATLNDLLAKARNSDLESGRD